MSKFKSIEYLKTGNSRQRRAYALLKELSVFDKLSDYAPVLAGTIPIDIDIPDSDLDIICMCTDHSEFAVTVTRLFGDKRGFTVGEKMFNGVRSTVVKFTTDDFAIEIFAQNIPTDKQNAYRHMVIENRILMNRGDEFRQKIRQLKQEGYKTEPAFAKLLGIKGDAYSELLKL
ncbi:MAG: DUF4269 domain-containing protein [Bacteroidales bacterium]|jgi:hypothetical protein|nr:DUF4269 domain-containing protein [Bacteroidales bacterium]